MRIPERRLLGFLRWHNVEVGGESQISETEGRAVQCRMGPVRLVAFVAFYVGWDYNNLVPFHPATHLLAVADDDLKGSNYPKACPSVLKRAIDRQGRPSAAGPSELCAAMLSSHAR